jgi:hypothetical protein
LPARLRSPAYGGGCACREGKFCYDSGQIDRFRCFGGDSMCRFVNGRMSVDALESEGDNVGVLFRTGVYRVFYRVFIARGEYDYCCEAGNYRCHFPQIEFYSFHFIYVCFKKK